MPVTSPDSIAYPDVTYTGGFVAALATMASSIQAAFSKRRAKSYEWADDTARNAQTGMTANSMGYQADNDTTYRYNATISQWVIFSRPLSAYTPTTTNITVGNGTMVSNYSLSNGWCIGEVIVNHGSTTSINPAITISLPVTTALTYSTDAILGAGSAYDLSTTTPYNVMVSFVTTGTIRIGVLGTAATYASRTGVTGSIPMSWANGDVLTIQFMYRYA